MTTELQTSFDRREILEFFFNITILEWEACHFQDHRFSTEKLDILNTKHFLDPEFFDSVWDS